MKAAIGGDTRLVSVVIPVYNGEPYLAEAIESVFNQDYRPLEMIVVNDGSTDNTEAVAKRYDKDITYVRQERRGPAAARNKGLHISRGEIIGFLDADDLWSEDKLSLQLACLAGNPSLEIVLGLSQRMKSKTAEKTKPNFEAWYDPFVAPSLGAAVFKRTVFDRIGLLDETLHFGEDVDWFMRARERGISMMIIEQVTHFYRIHESNMTLQAATRDSYLMRALKKSLDRRRREGRGQVAPFPKLRAIERE